ncbi:MAG: IS4 family transposase [Xenococcaceae cyanobacterium]
MTQPKKSPTKTTKKRSKARPRKTYNRDHYHRCQMSVPAIVEIEARIKQWLQPKTWKLTKMFFKKGKSESEKDQKLRGRKLDVMVMMAIVLSLIYRQINSLSEVVRILNLRGLMWVKAMKVSKQALSKRFQTLPAQIIADILTQTLESMKQAQPSEKLISEEYCQVRQSFSAIWIADGSTLEALKRKLKIWRDKKQVLGVKMMMLVEMFSHNPVKVWYSENAKDNDKLWSEQLLEYLPKKGLLVFDLGFFKLAWFDQFTQSQKYFLTRLREKTSYQVVKTLSVGLYFRDQIIEMGEYRSNPCKHQVRMVSVLWGQTWYHYLTNVVDPTILSAQQVCDLYRRRWSIEDAFAITKRLLGLSYLWVGDTNGVQIQLFASWIFYGVLNDLCSQVAVALSQPKEVISLEMVFRALAHFHQARVEQETDDLITYLVKHSQLFGLVKFRRKRHRQRDAISQNIWALTA